MGKFVDTQYTDTINSLIDGFKERLKNNFYAWNDKSSTIVTYYNINTELSVLDESTKLTYSTKGQFTGLKFNKINNFILYGIDKIALMIDLGEFGAEASEISGEAFVLPNTIVPYVGDFFIINHEKERLLFKIIVVHPDTLENGANIYRIEYKVTEIGDEDLIENNIAYTYEMIFKNIGTSLSPVIRSDKYNIIKNLDTIVSEMRDFYIDLFYTDRVQTFIFCHKDAHFYDPFLIEFLIRTKILSGGDEYIYLSHQISPYATFGIDYEKTFFRCVEEKDKKDLLKIYTNGYGEIIESKTNIFSTRYETYFKMVYRQTPGYTPDIQIVEPEFINRIIEGSLYDNDNILYNIIIKYFNSMDITEEDILNIENINYENNIRLFYFIPCVIFCLERYIKSLMS